MGLARRLTVILLFQMSEPWKPTREQVLAAEGKTISDVIAPNLRVLFCGINPGLYTAAVGHHFARPGNRFWKALHDARLTKTLLSPFDERELLNDGYGITNVVARATATANQLVEKRLSKAVRVWLRRCGATVRECWPYWVSARIEWPLRNRRQRLDDRKK